MHDFMTDFDTPFPTQMAKFFNDVEMGDVSGVHAALAVDPIEQELHPDQLLMIGMFQFISLTNNVYVLGPNSNGDNQYEIVTDPPSYWEIPPGKKIALQFNNSYQPLGLSTEKFRRSYDKLIRTGSLVHMRDEWGNVDPIKRQRLWEALMVCCIRNTLLIYIYLFVCFLLFCFCFLYFFLIFIEFNMSNFILCKHSTISRLDLMPMK
jgi:hypothetical protein